MNNVYIFTLISNLHWLSFSLSLYVVYICLWNHKLNKENRMHTVLFLYASTSFYRCVNCKYKYFSVTFILLSQIMENLFAIRENCKEKGSPDLAANWILFSQLEYENSWQQANRVFCKIKAVNVDTILLRLSWIRNQTWTKATLIENQNKLIVDNRRTVTVFLN